MKKRIPEALLIAAKEPLTATIQRTEAIEHAAAAKADKCRNEWKHKQRDKVKEREVQEDKRRKDSEAARNNGHERAVVVPVEIKADIRVGH
ncbi:hypothetical protein SARC_05144 [Sphaeroforma arctica JP610]|uniref:Uncharacterized protein n=1 Tax=Sphaeroforma arctica JP610 TaxID=667725 RepID=A0A0L0G0J6_9EUKA|nr:hypothetical protein SARC_05144 [Sphaeroforma arctica JP610]KNC82570.1 hypothetical protein SARC_05144 [Sphaeroforma arctica JP610]|eukprot:XP_014156472.1 hypothetical protein SARC_05144 [Sphaeroforma arctica JP610]